MGYCIVGLGMLHEFARHTRLWIGPCAQQSRTASDLNDTQDNLQEGQQKTQAADDDDRPKRHPLRRVPLIPPQLLLAPRLRIINLLREDREPAMQHGKVLIEPVHALLLCRNGGCSRFPATKLRQKRILACQRNVGGQQRC